MSRARHHGQAAGIILKAVLVIFTGYRPKAHDLGELERRCARACPGIGPLVPREALLHH